MGGGGGVIKWGFLETGLLEGVLNIRVAFQKGSLLERGLIERSY